MVAACVMTFEARDSAAKVVPARFKLSTTGPPPNLCHSHGSFTGHSHGSLRTSSVQTGNTPTALKHPRKHTCTRTSSDRRALTQSFMHFSRGLALDTNKCSFKISSQVYFV